MAENNEPTLPTFESLDELVAFFETQDMGEYWDQMPAVQFDVDLRRRVRLVPVETDLFEKLAAIAEAKQISIAHLIDSYLREKVT